MSIREDIHQELLKLQDIEYRDFQSKLIPTVGVEYFIGVRTPDLRKMAKTFAKRDDVDEFLQQLPHDYFDENQLHAFILSEMKDFENCVEKLQEFLPYVNNWATCDQMSPKIFKKHKKELLSLIGAWIASGETYSIRFGIKMLMEHFLDDEFDLSYPEKVAAVRSEEYYVNMMIAWYFATALAKQYEAIIPFIENKALDAWCHNKAIQKAIESYRITPEQKDYLRGLKIK